MTVAKTIVAKNKALAAHAAVLEAGRVANGRLLAIVKPKLPMMMRGYCDHPAAKLAIANAVSVAVQQYKPDSTVAQKLSDAMIASAYQEFIASFDIPGMLDEMMNSKDVKKVLDVCGFNSGSSDAE